MLIKLALPLCRIVDPVTHHGGHHWDDHQPGKPKVSNSAQSLIGRLELLFELTADLSLPELARVTDGCDAPDESEARDHNQQDDFHSNRSSRQVCGQFFLSLSDAMTITKRYLTS